AILGRLALAARTQRGRLVSDRAAVSPARARRLAERRHASRSGVARTAHRRGQQITWPPLVAPAAAGNRPANKDRRSARAGDETLPGVRLGCAVEEQVRPRRRELRRGAGWRRAGVAGNAGQRLRQTRG